MAVTRRVHRIGLSAAHHATFERRDYNPTTRQYDPAVFSPIEKALNDTLTNGERIVGTHYIDGVWVIITEDYGLGPLRQT